MFGMEVVDFDVENESPWITVRAKDGSVLKVKVEVTGLLRIGNDPNTGIPIYGVQVGTIVRLAKIPKELIVPVSQSTPAGNMPQYR